MAAAMVWAGAAVGVVTGVASAEGGARVVGVGGGQVVAEGNHAGGVGDGGLYARLASLQFADKVL